MNVSKIENIKNWITANGTPLEVIGQTTLELKFGNKIIKGNFIISTQLAHEVIIGVDILNKNKCIVDFGENKLECNGEKIEIKTRESELYRVN